MLHSFSAKTLLLNPYLFFILHMCKTSVYKNGNGEYNCFLLSDINVNSAQIKFEYEHQNLVHIQGNI